MTAIKKDYDYIFKFVIVGDLYVGKSAILIRFADDQFSEHYKSTIGVDFVRLAHSRDLELSKQAHRPRNFKLQEWDTAGQERYRTITNAYYKGADGVVVVFDMTNRESFKHVQNWIAEVHSIVGTDVQIMVLGNKCDLSESRDIPNTEMQKFEQDTGLIIQEVSAKESEGINEAFEELTKDILTKEKNKKKGERGKARGAPGMTLNQKHGLTKSGTFKSTCCQN